MVQKCLGLGKLCWWWSNRFVQKRSNLKQGRPSQFGTPYHTLYTLFTLELFSSDNRSQSKTANYGRPREEALNWYLSLTQCQATNFNPVEMLSWTAWVYTTKVAIESIQLMGSTPERVESLQIISTNWQLEGHGPARQWQQQMVYSSFILSENLINVQTIISTHLTSQFLQTCSVSLAQNYIFSNNLQTIIRQLIKSPHIFSIIAQGAKKRLNTVISTYQNIVTEPVTPRLLAGSTLWRRSLRNWNCQRTQFQLWCMFMLCV